MIVSWDRVGLLMHLRKWRMILPIAVETLAYFLPIFSAILVLSSPIHGNTKAELGVSRSAFFLKFIFSDMTALIPAVSIRRHVSSHPMTNIS